MMRDSSPARILIVDDDAIDREMLRRALRGADGALEIFEAEDGAEALAILRGADGRKPLDPPYFVVLDLNMPRMNGFEFLAELRADEALRQVSVFVLTTSDAPADIAAAHEFGIAGYILKTAAMRSTDALVSLLDSYARVVRLSP